MSNSKIPDIFMFLIKKEVISLDGETDEDKYDLLKKILASAGLWSSSFELKVKPVHKYPLIYCQTGSKKDIKERFTFLYEPKNLKFTIKLIVCRYNALKQFYIDQFKDTYMLTNCLNSTEATVNLEKGFEILWNERFTSSDIDNLWEGLLNYRDVNCGRKDHRGEYIGSLMYHTNVYRHTHGEDGTVLNPLTCEFTKKEHPVYVEIVRQYTAYINEL